VLDQGRGKAVEAGGHRSVGGEQVAWPGGGQRHVERLRRLFHQAESALEHGKGSVAFVQVAHFGADPERYQQSPPADAEEQFLSETQLGPAAVKLTGDPPPSGDVGGVVAVEQVQLHSADLDLPGPKPYRITRQHDLQPQPFAVGPADRCNRQLAGVVVGKSACCAPSLSIAWRK